MLKAGQAVEDKLAQLEADYNDAVAKQERDDSEEKETYSVNLTREDAF